MINKKRLIGLTQKLIRIDSQNPPGDESRLAQFIRDYLSCLGIKTKNYEFKKNRSNISAVLPGKNKGRSLLITPHLDTVPAGRGWHVDPFAASINRGRIYGLGATDCKGNLACCLEVMNSLIEGREVLDYNLIFSATADEESGSDFGLLPLLQKKILRPDAAVVLDADNFSIIVAQKGLLHLKVKVRGKRAHGAYPWLGVNAISIAVDIISDIRRHRFEYSRNKYLRPPTVNVGTIKGGDKVNVVADWCEFELDFRFLPGMSAEKILADLKKIIRKHTGKYSLEIEGTQDHFSMEESHPLVVYLKKVMQRQGVRPRIEGSEGATTISFFQRYGIPAVATGFGVETCAHSIDEYVKIDSLYKGARVLEEFLKIFKFS